MQIPEGYFGAFFARSGLSAKEGLRPANCTGVIDSDYRGEVRVALINMGSEDFAVNNGDRIAQMVIAPVEQAEIEPADALSDTGRGTGGFGSTGVSE